MSPWHSCFPSESSCWIIVKSHACAKGNLHSACLDGARFRNGPIGKLPLRIWCIHAKRANLHRNNDYVLGWPILMLETFVIPAVPLKKDGSCQKAIPESLQGWNVLIFYSLRIVKHVCFHVAVYTSALVNAFTKAVLTMSLCCREHFVLYFAYIWKLQQSNGSTVALFEMALNCSNLGRKMQTGGEGGHHWITDWIWFKMHPVRWKPRNPSSETSQIVRNPAAIPGEGQRVCELGNSATRTTVIKVHHLLNKGI